MAKERSSSLKQDKSTAHRFFFNKDGVAHHEFASAGQTANMGILYTILQHLQDTVHRKRPKMGPSVNWQIHHNTIVSACGTIISYTQNHTRAAISIFSPPCTV
jgi:hypothetical protein